jgi:hypothetical protein
MLWVALVIGALLAGKCLSFVSTLADTATKMAGSAAEPNSYQADMTPDWLMGLMGICFIELVGAVCGIWFFEGWIPGLVALTAAIALPAIFNVAVPPRRGSIVYLRSAAFTLLTHPSRVEMMGRLLAARPDIARYL